MSAPKILIADSISQSGVDELARGGALEVSTQTGLSESALVKIIPEFSGVVVRSQTKITAAILKAGTRTASGRPRRRGRRQCRCGGQPRGAA